MTLAGFFARVFIVCLAVPTAVVAMQFPALTDAYQADLTQAAHDSRAGIDQREQALKLRYGIAAQDDGGIVATLQGSDPTTADTMSDYQSRWRGLADAAARITSVGPTLRAFTALLDLAYDPRDERGAIWRATRDAFKPRLFLDFASLVYAVGGLMFGVLVAQVILGIIGLFGSRRAARA